jgi:hypothetical protein
MKPMIIVVAMAGVLLASPTPALAQRSEAGDRGVRLETNALRTDVRRERLRVPGARSSAAAISKRRAKAQATTKP